MLLRAEGDIGLIAPQNGPPKRVSLSYNLPPSLGGGFPNVARLGRLEFIARSYSLYPHVICNCPAREAYYHHIILFPYNAPLIGEVECGRGA